MVLALTITMASSARADWHLSPFVGANFGGSADDGNLRDAAGDPNKFTYGFDIGWMGAGIFGFDVDFAYTKNFFGDADVIGNNRLFTLIPGLIVGIPIGGQHGGGIRPYATGGIGIINRDLDFIDIDRFEGSDAVWSLGAGVMAYFSDHVGIKGDYRYIRKFSVDDLTDLDLNRLRDDPFQFNRVTVGVLFRF